MLNCNSIAFLPSDLDCRLTAERALLHYIKSRSVILADTRGIHIRHDIAHLRERLASQNIPRRQSSTIGCLGLSPASNTEACLTNVPSPPLSKSIQKVKKLPSLVTTMTCGALPLIATTDFTDADPDPNPELELLIRGTLNHAKSRAGSSISDTAEGR